MKEKLNHSSDWKEVREDEIKAIHQEFVPSRPGQEMEPEWWHFPNDVPIIGILLAERSKILFPQELGAVV